MIWNVLLPLAGTLLANRSASNASRDATNAANADADSDRALQKEMFERNIELNAPFRDAGLNALARMSPLLDYKKFSMDDFNADPGYSFRMSEGLKGVERSAAARGGLLSGATLKGINRYGQELASQEYQNAFNRYGAERDRALNPLQSMAGMGLTTSQQLGQSGMAHAGQMGDIGRYQAGVAGNAAMSRASTYRDTVNQLAYLGGRYLHSGGGRPSFGGGSHTFGEGEY